MSLCSLSVHEVNRSTLLSVTIVGFKDTLILYKVINKFCNFKQIDIMKPV